jgi:hypothetical protein
MDNKKILEYAIILTLNGNYKLKPLSQALKNLDDIEFELYGDDLKSIKIQYKDHLSELKQLGFI